MAGVHSFSLRAFQNLCTLISAASKLAQLRCLWQTKDSGQVSALTWSMAAYTCASKLRMGSLVQSTEITFFEAIFAPNAVNRSLLKRVILPNAVLHSADCWDSDTTVNQVLLTLAESQCHLDLENMKKWSKNLGADEIIESAFMKKRFQCSRIQ